MHNRNYLIVIIVIVFLQVPFDAVDDCHFSGPFEFLLFPLEKFITFLLRCYARTTKEILLAAPSGTFCFERKKPSLSLRPWGV